MELLEDCGSHGLRIAEALSTDDVILQLLFVASYLSTSLSWIAVNFLNHYDLSFVDNMMFNLKIFNMKKSFLLLLLSSVLSDVVEMMTLRYKIYIMV